ncbi:hypothetical protein P3X46_023098 [Hevea brasiliensis]|uniref:Uncharacterized protein n=1 Tax=Hevea brasiliensis TaxID=3981 RepID=A0ABQ9L9V0_HEVBR|nr:uncharacterized protein LOC110659421 [Hevea brasiliensis]KAJ9163430.1 hypothetical protein P3X46_023098 [Hevea brasiliensis]
MYVTRPLSLYKRDPSALSSPPPEGPNSGILVIQDEEAEPTCCFGLFKSHRVKNLPFPQNKNLKVLYDSGGEHNHVSINRVLFIPVLNLPLSSNLYYVIERKGSDKGKAYSSSNDEDNMEMCCFGCCISDMEPQALDPRDIYEQFEVQKRDWGGYVAKSVAPDGYPPRFLRRKGWRVSASTPYDFTLNEAPGLDRNLRARLPDFNFPLSEKTCAPVVVGKWYCPFMFIKEQGKLKGQMSGSRYYTMTLEQRWERIFECDNIEGKNSVAVDVVVKKEVVAVAGREGVLDEKNVVDGGVMWFRSSDDGGREASVGLSLAVVERVKWEQERVGWDGGRERRVSVKKVEEFGGIGERKKFGCYVLVERFVLRRMDGSLVLIWDFNHTHQIRSKWE